MKTDLSRVAKCANTRYLFRSGTALMNAENKPTQKDEEFIGRPTRIYTFYAQ
jgi:hypothetical protein